MNNSAIFGRIPVQHLSLNKLIQFGDHLLVDHPVIDAQHKEIFELGVKVYQDWSCGEGIDVLRPAVEKLSNLMHVHFGFEERVLSGIGYEDIKSHAAEHRSMRDELSLMNEQFRNYKGGREIRTGSLMAPGWSIMQFILGFTVGHVATSDMCYYRALAANKHLVSGLVDAS